MERIAPMTSATAETPTWMVCLGFAIPEDYFEFEARQYLSPRTTPYILSWFV
jgi:hypothetical protein